MGKLSTMPPLARTVCRCPMRPWREQGPAEGRVLCSVPSRNSQPTGLEHRHQRNRHDVLLNAAHARDIFGRNPNRLSPFFRLVRPKP